jgi:hypothetical protein
MSVGNVTNAGHSRSVSLRVVVGSSGHLLIDSNTKS